MRGEVDPWKVLELFHPTIASWFRSSFANPTIAQIKGWPAIASGESTLIFAPTGSGKTLTAFLWCINRLMFAYGAGAKGEGCRVLYISPLKALAVDVERNLRAPLIGIAHAANAAGIEFHQPTIGVRTGDTPQRDRARFLREPTDILITTPESLFLMLTSNARETLRTIDTVIIDEIHALVPTKRGAHLALSLERLELLCERRPQRIGLSATQRPLDEVAKFLNGFVADQSQSLPLLLPPEAEAALLPLSDEFTAGDSMTSRPRAVTIVDTGEKKHLEMRIEVPVEEMARLGEPVEIPSGAASQGPVRASIWPAIHPRLLELIKQHRSTLIFVNSRRLAERLAAALNELAGESIVRAHHGSIAREQRAEIEDDLKSGRLPALIATSSLELGIDMGAIDLVIQIEAPPSIASGMQRIGRASHQVGATSRGVIFPKFRGDLLACAAVTAAMHRGNIEAIRYPRNPLDVLAQQLVAITSFDEWTPDELYRIVRQAAPYAELSRTIFEGVLDMLSGVYPSDEFAELRPRIIWNRVDDVITARPGAKKIVIINGGTIPDRGLYGVFLAGAEKPSRVGELDEEMVFEARVGETFVLGASTWRIEEITHDRVLVSPAPGEPGKMPFWHGDTANRSVEFGEQIGQLLRELTSEKRELAAKRLVESHDLDERAAENLLQYIDDQRAATESVPDDRTILVERVRDELGDWRVCVLSPLGGRIHAPWAMAVIARVREEAGIDVEAMWSDDGFIIRFPDSDAPPDVELCLPNPEEIERLVVRQLGSSALFAARFRENATRALLLPRKRPGVRAPLWQQRRRAADLLHVAARFGSFPILLETYRECLRDIFDIPALVSTLQRLQQRVIRTVIVDTDKPSPFAGSLLFRYVANYIYDGDAPLAERRAQALSIDQSQLRELLGEGELRDLLDADAIAEVEEQLQQVAEKFRARNLDGLHDLLMRLGDLSSEEIALRTASSEVASSIDELAKQRRAIPIRIGGMDRFIAAEDSARYRDALGIPLPAGIPERFLQAVPDAAAELVLRYARHHGPFTAAEVATRYSLGKQLAESILARVVERGRVIEGEFRPGGTQREFCDSEVLRIIRRKSLAKLRKEVEPVEPESFVRFLSTWQGITRPKGGLNALLDTLENLQGYPLTASILETDILPARVAGYKPSDLDTLMAAGEVIWVGSEPLGERDGRLQIYLTDQFPRLHQSQPEATLTEKQTQVLEFLSQGGASFFATIHEGIGGGFPSETVDALWDLLWAGLISNDTFHAMRSYIGRGAAGKKRIVPGGAFRSRRVAPQGAEGRWSLAPAKRSTLEQRSIALAQQLLARYGVLTREAVAAEEIRGGFSAVYDVLKVLEESGKIRRGFFVGGVAATQFAVPAAVDLLRAVRDQGEALETTMLAAADPANPYGTILKWPSTGTFGRYVGAHVILVDGSLACYISRGEKQLIVQLPEEEPNRSRTAKEIARTLVSLVTEGRRRALLINEINGAPAIQHILADSLRSAGFVASGSSLQLRALVRRDGLRA